MIAIYNSLRITIHLHMPLAIVFTSEAVTTLRRVQEFLLLEELGDTSSVLRCNEKAPGTDSKIVAFNLSASWDKESTQTETLHDISFEVRPGELLAVIGPVGAGKSSLLMALLGELPLTSGSVKVNGTVAYASQQPWVFAGTVRQNVVFGRPYIEDKYDRAVKAAALIKDLEIMQDGDQTLVGEKGISLSGGQKARISLARAIYFDADVYLLDDPLSAVDTAVGRHLFDKCVNGILEKKPRILVTHQLQYLQSADRILILKEGKCLGMGTFDHLSRSGIDFSSLLKHEQDTEPITSPGSNLSTNYSVTYTHSVPNPLIDETVSPLSNFLIDENPRMSLIMDNPDKYLSKSLDTGTILGKSLKQSPSRVANESDHTDSPLLKTHQSLLALHKKHSTEKSTHSPLPHLSFSHTGHSRDQKKPGAVRRLLSEESAGRVSLTRSMENVAGGIMVGSMMSLGSIEPEIQPDHVAKVQDEEKRAEGTIQVKYYFKYFFSGGGAFGLIFLVLANLLAQGAFIASDWWLSYWATEEEIRSEQVLEREQFIEEWRRNMSNYNLTYTNSTDIVGLEEIDEIPRNTYIYIYTAITLSVFVFGLIRALLIFKILIRAGRVLHNKMFAAVVRCPVLFFDTNPVGRILNRFSKDMGLLDENLPLVMFDFIQCALMILGYILVCGFVNPWVFIPTAPLIVAFIFIRKYYLATSRDIKRLEATTRSPVYSHLSASINGLQTIRAYQVQATFVQEFNKHQDLHSEAWFLFLATSRWFAVRLDLLCACFLTAVSMCSVFAADSLSGGMVGLTLTYAMALMGLFQWGVRQSAEVENQMTSVERVFEYTELPPEAALESVKDNKPPDDWPKYGVITGENVSFRYSQDGAFVLKNLRFCVRAQEKLGVCGRTGAGKSSLMAMLFRLAEPEGLIRIDGVDIKQLGLHDLRRVISIIPQDPMLFNGTIRKNLDPFDRHTDKGLWNALDEVQLKPAIEDLAEQLEHMVDEGGKNFSVGQRQLLCLARAILIQNKILIIDEATANVDPRTDALIQQTIREKFAQCTVLTIAHRLHTIMDSDRVMVLSEGEIMECDEPYRLLQDTNGYFYKMLEQTGASECAHLHGLAKDCFTDKHGDTQSVLDNLLPMPANGATTRAS